VTAQQTTIVLREDETVSLSGGSIRSTFQVSVIDVIHLVSPAVPARCYVIAFCNHFS